MSAIATKKMGGDAATQLTFPSVYQSVYAARGPQQRYYPQPYKPSEPLPVGRDFQSHYHEQKRRDADYMAMAKVKATDSSRQFLLTRRNMLPTPVRSQRIFANPSNGSFSAVSARQDYRDAPFNYMGSSYEVGSGMSGGVLRSKAGMRYAKKILQRRAENLDSIEGLAMAAPFPGMMGAPGALGGPSTVSGPRDMAETEKVEMSVLFQDCFRAVQAGDPSGFALERFGRFLQMLFRFGPTATTNELEDINDALDELIGQTTPDDDYNARPYRGVYGEGGQSQYALAIYDLATKAKQYVREMLRGVNLQPNERADLSKAMIKTLNFGKIQALVQGETAHQYLGQERRRRGLNPTVSSYFEDDDDDDDESRFDRPARPREDTEQGYSRADYSSGRVPTRGTRTTASSTTRGTFQEDEEGVEGFDEDERWGEGDVWGATGAYLPESGEEAPDLGDEDGRLDAYRALVLEQEGIAPAFTEEGEAGYDEAIAAAQERGRQLADADFTGAPPPPVRAQPRVRSRRAALPAPAPPASVATGVSEAAPSETGATVASRSTKGKKAARVKDAKADARSRLGVSSAADVNKLITEAGRGASAVERLQALLYDRILQRPGGRRSGNTTYLRKQIRNSLL